MHLSALVAGRHLSPSLCATRPLLRVLQLPPSCFTPASAQPLPLLLGSALLVLLLIKPQAFGKLQIPLLLKVMATSITCMDVMAFTIAISHFALLQDRDFWSQSPAIGLLMMLFKPLVLLPVGKVIEQALFLPVKLSVVISLPILGKSLLFAHLQNAHLVGTSPPLDASRHPNQRQ